MTTYRNWKKQSESTGTVSSVGVNTGNGFSGSVSDPTGEARINLQTTITGLLKGNGVAISAASPADIPVENDISSSVNTMTSVVNSEISTAPIINSIALDLTGTTLTSTVNGQVSTNVSVQPLIDSPTADNLVSMDGLGKVKNAVVKTTTSSASNSTTEIMTSSAVQTVAATKEPTITVLPISKGGTGETSALAALNALLPNQSMSNGEFLTTDGTNADWVSLSGISVTSFKARTGAVVPNSGDYDVSQITGAAPILSPVLTGNPTAPTQTAGDNSTKIATTAYADSGIALKANIASPAFTGTPTAPTASPGTNSGQLATTAYADTGLSLKANIASPALTGTPTAPTATAGTSTTQLATTAFATTGLNLKAPLASPALTGVPTAPTALAGTNSTQIATTAYTDSGLVLKADITYVNDGLTLKANTASPAFTGTPTAPTSVPGTNTTQLATTAFVTTAGALKADLASPALTGNPTAPTQLPGNNSTRLSTTAYVDTALSAKADLASPALTGNPTAPTATAGTSTTQIATTAFVISTVAASGVTSFKARTGAVTPAAGDYDVSLVTNAASLISPAFTGTPTAPTPTAGDSTTKIATTAFVTSVDILKAPIASPAFTGTPTAPTATAGTSTTQLATTAFATTADALKADLVSPAFTGNPTVPTQLDNNNSTRVASTAAVRGITNNQVSSFNNVTPVSGYSPDIIIAMGFVSPMQTIAGDFDLHITDGITASLIIKFQAFFSAYSFSGNPKLIIQDVSDSNGVINIDNISNYITFMRHQKNTGSSPDQYIALTCRIINGVYASTASLLYIVTNYSEAFLRDNTNSLYTSKPLSNLIAPDSSYIMNCRTTDNNYISFASYAYALNVSSNNISQFLLSNTGASFTAMSTATINTGVSPNSIICTPNKKFIFVLNSGASTISSYRTNPRTGLLTLVSATAASAVGLNFSAMHPNINIPVFYAPDQTNGALNVFNIDMSTGALTKTTALAGTSPRSAAVHPNGYWMYVTNYAGNTVGQYNIDQTTGAPTYMQIATVSGTNPYRCTVSPDGGFLWFTSYSNGTITRYTISKSTGALSSPLTVNVGANPNDVQITPNGRFLYVSCQTSTNLIYCFGLNEDGTVVALSTPTVTASNISSIKISSSGRLLYACSNTNSNFLVFTINAVTGVLSLINTITTPSTTSDILII